MSQNPSSRPIPSSSLQPKIPDPDGADGEEGATHLSNFIVGGVALLGIASVVSAGMLHSLFHCGRGFLHASYATFVGLFGAIAAVLLLCGAVGGSVFFFAVFAFGLVALRRRKHRIAFGSANLKVYLGGGGVGVSKGVRFEFCKGLGGGDAGPAGPSQSQRLSQIFGRLVATQQMQTAGSNSWTWCLLCASTTVLPDKRLPQRCRGCGGEFASICLSVVGQS